MNTLVQKMGEASKENIVNIVNASYMMQAIGNFT